ncbi:type II toxin-antitoxin system RelE/ParE family toxin [Treponema berlinense]|uniref:type II toxin-antitoxin system RelE family toxin n=1 Tax=Treponema berlinense TaxID=225004 RepID=UPI0026EB1200|nr:type II toxin-antitoxin system RelE/ParE family toxin [Treponema berlinense]
MAYKIEFEERAFEDFSKLDGSVKKQIQKYLDKLAMRENPRTLGEPLQENLSAYWKYRVGDYRLVAEIKDDVLVVLMLAVGHRRDIYKSASKRLN